MNRGKLIFDVLLPVLLAVFTIVHACCIAYDYGRADGYKLGHADGERWERAYNDNQPFGTLRTLTPEEFIAEQSPVK